MDTSINPIFMQRALDLALLGTSRVSPNPLVGAVVVHENRIIGEGYHQAYGQAHAEVNAIKAVKSTELLPFSTIYVNLEPCSHFGKTPPCADLIIEKSIPRVVVGSTDPNPLVSGKGIERLRAANIEVIEDVLVQKSDFMNRRFFTFIKKKRPYIILKWAESINQFMGKTDESFWISSQQSKILVHQWRTQEDAFLVGTQTAQQDNPQLTARLWQGRNPIRIVLDRNLRLDKNLAIFDRQQKTLCYNLVKNEKLENLYFIKLSQQNFLAEMLQDLFSQNIQSVVVEGGKQSLKLFLEANLFDEIRIFRSPQVIGQGIASPQPKGILLEQRKVGNDQLLVFLNPNY